jgi:4'-phosphopantetheinyl transferase
MKQSKNIADPNFKVEASLALPDNEVHLWRLDLAAIASNEVRWQSMLSDEEKQRASRFHFTVDRQRYVTSRAVLRMLLAAYLGIGPGIEPSEIAFSYSAKEKPLLAPPHADSGVMFNLSHSAEVALLAFTRRRRIGVDVELIRPDIELDRIARRFFSEREQKELSTKKDEDKASAFFRCWTRKEAYIKAVGDGLSLPLAQFDVTLEDADKDKNLLLATRPDASEAGHWLLREVPAGDGYAAALCVEGNDWQLHDWH